MMTRKISFRTRSPGELGYISEGLKAVPRGVRNHKSRICDDQCNYCCTEEILQRRNAIDLVFSVKREMDPGVLELIYKQ